MMFGRDMEKLKSFLGTQSELQGNLTVTGILRLDGNACGKIRADEVILGATAVMNGDVLARKIIVGGRVEGSLRATDLVEIGSKGKVKGDIYTNKLVVIEGGEFNGRIEMKADKLNVLDFESRSQEIFLKR
jgi:cytoskeletal protein CcmA (bactofilin family)